MEEDLDLIELQFPTMFPIGTKVKYVRKVLVEDDDWNTKRAHKMINEFHHSWKYGKVYKHVNHHGHRWNRVIFKEEYEFDFLTGELAIA
jgi:hypothetical protein